jgi:hypothetical protein
MRLSRRLTGVVLVLAFAGALAPGALAGKRKPAPAPEAPAYVTPGQNTYMVDIEALR